MVDCQCPPPYILSVPGILKIVEMVFTIITFACSFGNAWSYYGGGWVEFTGISCFICIAIWFILHLINLVPQFLVNFLVEFISYIVMTIMLLIAGIVAASRAAWFAEPWKSTVGAAAFFAFAAMVCCAVDATFQYMEYRRGGGGGGGGGTTTESTTTTTVHTTHSSSAVKVEY